MSAVTTVLAGVAFGLALAAPPGPMNAIIAEESVHRGFQAGVLTGLGAMIADGIFFVFALVGVVAIVHQIPAIRDGMLFVGGLLMFYFAYGTLQELSTSFTTGHSSTSRGFWKALLLGLSNPYQILFWLTVGIVLLSPGTLDLFGSISPALADIFVVQTGSILLIIGLFSGIILWIIFFPLLLVTAQKRINSFGPIIALVSALILAGFGLYFISDVLM